MEVGRELDALVAEKVMGMTITTVEEFNTWEYAIAKGARVLKNMTKEQKQKRFWRVVKKGNGEHIPTYSSDMASAWRVVEKMREGQIFLAVCPYAMTYEVQALNDDMVAVATVIEDTAPHAICLAALEALGVEVTG